jgi:hypothetical protein
VNKLIFEKKKNSFCCCCCFETLFFIACFDDGECYGVGAFQNGVCNTNSTPPGKAREGD